MSSLRDRLRRQLGDPSPAPAGDPAPEAPADPDPSAVGQRLARLMRARSTREALSGAARRQKDDARVARRAERRELATEDLRRTPRPRDPARPLCHPPRLPMAEATNSEGTFLWGELDLPPAHQHGALPLQGALELDGPTARLLSGDDALLAFDPTRALFFDLETTGLMGGSGNLAFLCGMLRLREDGSVTVMQTLLRAPGDEGAALRRIEEELEAVDALVSFNGKSFDRNVLADRLTMNRRPPERPLALPHLDLLHPARRLFARSMPRCTLGALEEDRLGVYRDELEDVPGAEVPGRWFRYLREGKAELLAPVVDHNTLDLLTLATLAGHLAGCLRAPGAHLTEPRALLGAAQILIDRGEPERGESVLRELSGGAAQDPPVYAALGRLAEHLRASGRWGEALPLWERMMEAAGASDPGPWRDAAVALEWRLGDPAAALVVVEDFLARIDGVTAAILAPEVEAMTARRVRLLGKVDRG